MKNKIIFLILIFFIFMNNISASDFPTNGTDEQKQNWVLGNPESFNPADNFQKDAFLQAYSEDKIDLRKPENKKAVEKYLTSQKMISQNDRKILEDLVEYYTLD